MSSAGDHSSGIFLSILSSTEICLNCKTKKISDLCWISATTSGFDGPLLYRVSYEARREKVVGDSDRTIAQTIYYPSGLKSGIIFPTRVETGIRRHSWHKGRV